MISEKSSSLALQVCAFTSPLRLELIIKFISISESTPDRRLLHKCPE